MIPAAAGRPGGCPWQRWSLLLLMLAAGSVLTLVFHYPSHWAHPEITMRDIPHAMENGTALRWADLVRGLDCWRFDGVSRPRFVSHLVKLVSLKIRLQVFRFLPPHPSLSLAWFGLLVLVPLLFLPVARHWTGSRAGSYAALAVLLLSPGFLSVLVLQHHPAKALSLIFLVVLLWAAVRPHSVFRRVLLLTCILLSLYADEYGLVLYALVPLLAPVLFRRKRFSAAYLACLAFFLVSLTVIIPPCTRALGYGTFDYWRYALHGENEHGIPFDYRPLVSNISVPAVTANTYWLFASHLLPRQAGEDPDFDIPDFFSRIWWPVLAPVTRQLLVPVLAVLFLLWTDLDAGRRRRLLQLFAACLWFALLHSIINARHNIYIPDCYYYGAPFSVLFALAAGMLWSIPRRQALRLLSLLLLLAVCGVNFITFNRSWFVREWRDPRPLTREMVSRAWQARRQPETLHRLQQQYPQHAEWLFAELPLIP